MKKKRSWRSEIWWGKADIFFAVGNIGLIREISTEAAGASLSDKMNVTPGQPPYEWTDRSNRLRACALFPRMTYVLTRG